MYFQLRGHRTEEEIKAKKRSLLEKHYNDLKDSKTENLNNEGSDTLRDTLRDPILEIDLESYPGKKPGDILCSLDSL